MFNRPSGVQSIEQFGVSNPIMARSGFDSWKCLTECSYAFVESAMLRPLLDHGGPSTVALFVVRVGIYSVNGVLAFRSMSHISQEILKGMQPSVANENPTASPIFIIFEFSVVTSALHSKPRLVFDRCIPASLVAMFDGLFRPDRYKGSVTAHVRGPFRLDAPTRLCYAGSQILSTDDFFFSAVALTKPPSAATYVSSELQNKQPGESLPSEINADIFHISEFYHTSSQQVH